MKWLPAISTRLFTSIAQTIALWGLSAAAHAAITPYYETRLDKPVLVAQLTVEGIDGPARAVALMSDELNRVSFPDGGSPRITLRLAENLDVETAKLERSEMLRKHDSFLIDVQPDLIQITATTHSALWYALDQLIAELNDGKGSLKYRYIYDGADHEIRAMHMVLRSMSVAEVERIILLARQNRFNTFMILLADGVALDADAVTPRPDAISATELRRIVEDIRAMGMSFVPEMSLLTHQGRFFKRRHPQLLFNEQTYDPRNDKVYELVFEYLDEVIRITSPDAIHIGHDEVAGTYNLDKQNWRLPDDEILPPDLFLADVIRLHEYLTERDIPVWMWGDMLVSAEEVGKPNNPNLHGGQGHAKIRPDLPRDIFICDWHYWDKSGNFPSSRLLVEEGFRVLGTTWKRRDVTRGFSRYVGDLGPQAPGMIATTWWHVQKRHWPVVEKIAVDAGEAFWRLP